MSSKQVFLMQKGFQSVTCNIPSHGNATWAAMFTLAREETSATSHCEKKATGNSSVEEA